MNKKNTNDGIGNHPEADKIKEICDVSPEAPESKKVCKKVNKFRKKIKR